MKQNRPLVTIYTDGACRGNPGPGGWAYLLECRGHEKEASGFAAHTTNNRMELQAAIEALQALKKPSTVRLYTDSRYLQQGINQWLAGWKKNNFKTSSGAPVKNQDLWVTLDQLCALHHIEWLWVKAHAGLDANERVDTLARQESQRV